MKLEEFINKNKESFEEEVSGDLWSKLEKQIPKKPKNTIWLNSKILRIAAGIIICLSVGFWFGKYSKNEVFASKQDKLISSEPTLASYSEKVTEKRKNLEDLIEKNPELQKAFLNDLSDLQKNFEYLKSQLPHNPNHDQLFEAMVQNLKWQIELLNQQTAIAVDVNKHELL
jgi:predicted RNase H-like nuclease (RuvC/YqgF family)